jgi:(E)-4-hydroxy-3-methyl-but-2-enyl pyrophosphate reductase
MKVIVAKSAGFCRGVNRALSLARRLVRQAGEPIHTDGPLIHNREMMAELHREGIRESETPESLGCGTLVVRAHGISPQRRQALQALPVNLVDATCPDVARSQAAVRKWSKAGYSVVIFGDPGHPEVVGLQGFSDPPARVVAGVEDVAGLPALERVCLVAQSTQLPASYREVADAVTARFPASRIVDTICESTKRRQEELVEMAASVEAFVVVGDPKSANTRRLVAVARSLRPTWHVRTASDLDAAELARFACVGVTAGASTPGFLIREVRDALSSMGGMAHA